MPATELELRTRAIAERDFEAPRVFNVEGHPEMARAFIDVGQAVLLQLADEPAVNFNGDVLRFFLTTRRLAQERRFDRLAASTSHDPGVMELRAGEMSALRREFLVTNAMIDEVRLLSTQMTARYGPLAEPMVFGKFRETVVNTVDLARQLLRGRLAAIRRALGREEARTPGELRRRQLRDP